jgi:hypothetical protein
MSNVKKAEARARATNDRSIVAGVDGRVLWCRRLADLIALYENDLGSDLPEPRRSIVRRAATLTIELERLEAKFATAPDGASRAELDGYQRAANSLRRLLESNGLDRVAKVIENPNVTAFNAREAERLKQYENMPEPDYSVSDFTKEGQP